MTDYYERQRRENILRDVTKSPDFIYSYNESGEKSINPMSVLILAVLQVNENLDAIRELLEEKFA